MRKEDRKSEEAVVRSGRVNGFLPTSIRALSGYLRIASSGASNVASTVRSAASAASAIVDRENRETHDQVNWAGFDNLNYEGNIARQVLLLGYQSGFQVWDVGEADNVRELISRYNGPVSFLQIQPNPIVPNSSKDKFADARPLLSVCADDTFSSGAKVNNESIQNSDGFLPTAVWFYSFKSQSYVHVLNFRSFVYSVRCSPRVVAVLQASQIHCFDAATLEREFTILTNPIVNTCFGAGSIGLGPLALGPRWIAYSGPRVVAFNSESASFPCPVSNESFVEHAKESSKQLAAGIVTLGGRFNKKLSKYYSDLLSEGNRSLHSNNLGRNERGSRNGHLLDPENVGMVTVRDVVGKLVIAQFRAHKSPISSLCFDPSGTLLVTASVQGHNINVFRITPGFSGSGASYEHLYRLQRGFTNAVIQDISFSYDSSWIMVSSLRGTSHLFSISPSGGFVNLERTDDAYFTTKNNGSGEINKPTVYGSPNSVLQMPNEESFYSSNYPITLTAVSRIRSGNNGWTSTVTGAAAAATGRMSSPCGPIASAFLSNYRLLVFSPGSMIQYSLRVLSSPLYSVTSESETECDARLVVEPIQKWNICQKQNQREEEEIDIYGENRSSCSRTNEKCAKVKSSPKERDRIYIAEAELQVHKAWNPFWAKPMIHLHPMVKDVEEEDASRGEFEIEKIPIRNVEARRKAFTSKSDHDLSKLP